MLKLKQLSKLELTGLTSIISQRKCLPVLWSIALLTAGLSFSSWSLAAFMPEALKRIDIVYYIYFPWYKKYKTEKIKGCHGFFLHSGSAVLRCEENVSLLRPLHTIKAWRRQQSKMGFLSLTMDEFGIKNVHGYIKKIQSISLDTFSIHKKNGKERPVIGKFIRHVNDVRKYRFKNRTTGKISTVFSTPNHPFYVKNKGMFIPIETISPEDEMLQKDGQIMKMICSTPHGTGCGAHSGESMVSVYNLEIAQKHTYFVGQDFILVHNQCRRHPETREIIPAHKRFSWLAKNGFIKCIPDGSNEGRITLSFKLRWEDREKFSQRCGGLSTNSIHHVLSTHVYYPLTQLGFERIDKQIARDVRLKTPILWILRNGDGFNDKMEKLGWSVSIPGSDSLYFDSIISPIPIPILVSFPAPVPTSIPAFTATPNATSTFAPSTFIFDPTTFTFIPASTAPVSTSGFDFTDVETLASTSTGAALPD